MDVQVSAVAGGQVPWLTTELSTPPGRTKPPPLEPCFMLHGPARTAPEKLSKPWKGELQTTGRSAS
jgi:hypothetical protein